ncbi:hypothetical protein TWF718_005900 [Orbilia javanica]|uniref:BTB domain-containing protein n=1 Tax=Orbilia javanica TaxID=47235 RepID=A0AAN8RJE9_9PEZI
MEPLPLSEILQSPTIALVVGSTEKPGVQPVTYHVHEAVLIQSSDYFKQLLNSNFSENVKKGVQLDSAVDTPQACQLFLDFAYHGRCDPPKTPNALLSYGEAYLFGEKILATEFKKYVYEQAREEAERSFRDLDFSFKTIKTMDPLSKGRVELLETWGLLVEKIYTGTYDYKDRYIDEAAPSDASTPFKEHLESMKHLLETDGVDMFRGLLSQFCAQYPLIIASSPRMMRLHRTTPEFAADIYDHQMKITLQELEEAQIYAAPHHYAVTSRKVVR